MLFRSERSLGWGGKAGHPSFVSVILTLHVSRRLEALF